MIVGAPLRIRMKFWPPPEPASICPAIVTDWLAVIVLIPSVRESALPAGLDVMLTLQASRVIVPEVLVFSTPERVIVP